jgi:hypothetical protein
MGARQGQSLLGWPNVLEIVFAVSCNLGSQLSSSLSAGAEIDNPANSLPWSS